MTADIWAPLTEELDRWQADGKVAQFWLRDDDAVDPTPALSRLLEISARHAAPVTLAVIPAHSGQVLADFLADTSLVSVAVHGWSHANHAGEGEKKQELGAHRPVATVAAELEAGFEKLRFLHAGRFAAMLVPPWNRIAAPLAAELPALGFDALSVFGAEKASPIRLINTHVDLMDWHGTRGARDYQALVSDMIARLREMSDTGGVMGFLTHHLVHDERGWRFIEELLERTARHPGCRWAYLPEMLARN